MQARITALLGLALVLLAPGPAPAAADPTAPASPDPGGAAITLEELVVTGEKLGRPVQELPVSVSVFSEGEIEDLGLERSERLFDLVPNLHLVTMGPQAMFGTPVSMRGLSSFMTGSPVLSLLVDDVHYPGLSLNLVDVERIEVLRGPQGAMFGRNTEAGLINIITRQAENYWQGKAALELGDYNTQRVDFAAGGALVEDKLFLRAAGRYETSDGYFHNRADGSSDVDQRRNLDGRLALRWLPNPDLDLSWVTDTQDYDSNNAEFALLDQVERDPHQVSLDFAGEARKRSLGSSLRAQQRLGALKLLSITAWRDEDAFSYQDIDFTSYDLMRLKLKKDSQTVSEELRLVSDRPHSPLQWLAGAFAYHETDDLDYTTELRPMSGMTGFLRQRGDTTTLGSALFGQASYTFLDFLEVTAGLRYDRESKDFDYAWSGGAFGVPNLSGANDHVFDAWLPKLAVSLRLAQGFMPYLSLARGFKSGGFNLKAAAGAPYDSEFAWNYEAGVKTEWLQRRLTLNLAAFYSDWRDLQVEQPDYPDFTIVNAASATSQGLEAEARLRPLKALELFANFGCVESTFDEFSQGGADYAGNHVPNVPEYTYRLGGVYRFLKGYFVSAEYLGIGPLHWDAANSRQQSAYQIVNARLGYELEHLKAYVFARNLFDETYATRAFQMSEQWYGRAGDPLTFGVSLVLEF